MAKTTTWTGATDLSSYFTATNWTNGVPGAGDTEIIPLRLPKATGLNLVGQTVNLTAPPNSAKTLFTIINTAAAPSLLDAATVVNGGDNLVELDGNVVNNGKIFDTDLSLVDATGGTGVAANASLFTNNGTITYDVAPPSDPGFLISGSTFTGLLNNGTVNVASPAEAIATGNPGDPFPVQLDVFGPVTGSGTFNVTGGFPNGAKPPPNSTQPHKSQLFFHGLVSTTGAINLNDASVQFLQYTNSATVNFQDASSAVYVTDASQNQSGVTITGFRAGDVVGLNTTKVTQAVYDNVKKVVDLEETNGQIDSFLTIVAGAGQVLSTASFAISKSYGTDTGENFLTTTLAAPSVSCFAENTHISAKTGQIRVQDLRVGDHVLNHFGCYKPIIWIGHRRIDCRRHPDPRQVWPVRIIAGAFGDDLPSRDLWLSPDHAVFVDGVLIPAKRLVNDCTIAQDPCDEVTYHHVEFDRHDVVFAEGLPAESYFETGDRSNFEGGERPTRLHPDFSALAWEAEGCAPLVITGSVLASVRARLLEHAATLADPLPRRASGPEALPSANAARVRYQEAS